MKEDLEWMEDPLPPSFSDELFVEWRSPRQGFSNPERMDNPVWEWLVQTGVSAYRANNVCHGPCSFDAGPVWCFERFGQSSTLLPDGRTVLIAGEHEDHYDPDFYIYNDVVVRHPEGRMEIYVYPHEAFPPTDFHSATLAGNRIVIIGNLGYPRQRKAGITQVLALDLETMAVNEIATSGVGPGWIHKHKATLADNGLSIVLQGGMVDTGVKDSSLLENIDDWCLHLADWRWERLTTRNWPRREILRTDHKSLRTWEISRAVWYHQMGWAKDFQEAVDGLEKHGITLDLDVTSRLYQPAIPHEEIPRDEDKDDEYNVFRVRVDGVVVRFVSEYYQVQMTVEGDLPVETVEALATDFQSKLSCLQNVPCEVRIL